MGNLITVKHSYNAGDAVTTLPGLQKLYKETGCKIKFYQRLNLPADYGHGDNHPIKDENDRRVCMNEKTWNMLCPLLESQEYIGECEIWKGQEVVFDFDNTRLHSQMPLPNGSIHHWIFLMNPQLECDLSIPWLKVNPVVGYADKIIINRTERYTNPYIHYYFLRDHQNDIIFSGLPVEYEKFCKDFELDIPLLVVKDFLELTQIISSCRFFIGNQSFQFHIADALKKERILEVCTAYPNTFPTGKNGRSFVKQNSLEHYFREMIKLTQ